MKFGIIAFLLGLSGLANADIPIPHSDGDRNHGYRSIPIPETFKLVRRKLFDGKNLTVPILESSSVHDVKTVKRVIVDIHGKTNWIDEKNRDCWRDAAQVKNAQLKAVEQGRLDGGVLILGVCFMAEVDRKAGAAKPSDLGFGLNTWNSGKKASSPEEADEISSFDVLDALSDIYLNTDEYPNVEAITFVGHSLGAQTVQRYATIGKSKSNEDRIHYWTGNPGSLLWFTKDRPYPDIASSCEGYDRYKFGFGGGFPAYDLSNVHDLGRDGLIQRYRGRIVHHLFGLKDNEQGDTSCQAMSQGATHLERGQGFNKILEGLGGDTGNTVTWVPGIGHDGAAMYLSPEGIEKMFLYKS